MDSNQINHQINLYLDALKDALQGQDKALIQDALFDAEDHLRAAIKDTQSDANSFEDVVENYGSPQEIAQLYCEMETTVNHAIHGNRKTSAPIIKNRFFAILTNGDAYRALLYTLLAAPLGMAYFAWVSLFGLTSLAACLLTIGIPLFLIFLKSMQLFSLFEGRLIEMLLGQRMPRRPIYQRKDPTQGKWAYWISSIKDILKNRRSYTTALYMVLQAGLGLGYFMTIFSGALMSIVIFLSPIVDPIVHAIDPSQTIEIDWYWFPLAMPGGVLGFIICLHLAKFVGKYQAKLARYLLVNIDDS